MQFPEFRPRRMRRTEALRQLVRETELRPSDLVAPLFVIPGQGIRKEVASMPGVHSGSVDLIGEEVAELAAAGISAVLLFGIPERKDAVGSEAWDDRGVVQRATLALKKSHPTMPIIADVCLCEYTDHGHCGLLHKGEVDNDATLENLGRVALSYAKAGVDVIAPSGMMDGVVGFLREMLDEGGYEQIPILAYSAKYASSFYGPFREAGQTALPKTEDRRGYQMDPANANEALREALLDVGEGADMIMVKPALPYLDIVRRVRQEINLPIFAYNVSGEYAMLKAAGERGWIDYDRAVLEVLTAIKRAGADRIITYHAREAAALLRRA